VKNSEKILPQVYVLLRQISSVSGKESNDKLIAKTIPDCFDEKLNAIKPLLYQKLMG